MWNELFLRLHSDKNIQNVLKEKNLREMLGRELNTRNNAALRGCTLYVTLFPCNECSKAIIQTGIQEVVYADNKYKEQIATQASLKMLTLACVKVRRYEGRKLKISVDE